jgi:hypothetical protein
LSKRKKNSEGFVHELGFGDAPIAFIIKIPKIGLCENRAGIFDDLEFFLVDVASMVSIRAIEEASYISSPLVASKDAKIGMMPPGIPWMMPSTVTE